MADRPSFIVIGGGGFLARRIIHLLSSRPHSRISALDIRLPSFPDYPNVVPLQADITDYSTLAAHIADHDVVIHTASPIHGSSKEVFFKVNVDGTRNVIRACVENRVKALVYTSSASVIFDGTDLVGADESAPYVQNHMDAYNESKAVAEEMVLKANGQSGVLTIAIRPSGIYGPADNQGMVTFFEMARSGRSYRFMVGSNKNMFDWTYVDNAAHAHLLAADALLSPTKSAKCAGQVFIVTDDNPIAFWDLPKTFFNGLGLRDAHSIVIPSIVAYFIAYLMQAVAVLLSPFVTLHPTFTPFRLKMAGANRWFRIEKAKRDLGYKPIVSGEEGLQRCVEYYQPLLAKSRGLGGAGHESKVRSAKEE
ncbi:3-beta hydroxysteroid dehydrogenase/isomerase family-domain-containing protein [Cladochytrium replicatum]|nr:3-beta hydroxysteroid dehydrogenase/isomerase family-domain-containing protein [Cladochytrium replicatum]